VISKKNNDFIDYQVLQNVMQSDLDNLIVPSLRRTIEENLGVKTLNKIEQRLIERHGINLAQSIKEFYKFDSVLREFFGAGADGLETKFLNEIVELEKAIKIGQTTGKIDLQNSIKYFYGKIDLHTVLDLLKYRFQSMKVQFKRISENGSEKIFIQHDLGKNWP